MPRKHVSTSKRSRTKARQVRREAREVRELLCEPVKTRRGVNRRAAQNRRRCFKACCWLGALTAVGAAAWMLLERAFYDNPEFMLQHVEVVTDGTLTKQEILQTAQVPAVINLLKIDLAGIDQRLRQRSQVKEVRVKRQVPDTLEITVWERTPIAWLGYQGARLDKHENGVLLDADGYAICCHTLYREFYDFPVILVPREVIAEFVLFGERLDLPSIHSALELVQLWPSGAPAANLRISQIDASRHYRLLVDCQPEMRLVFQPENLPGQLIKLGDALRHGAQRNRYFAQVDLTVSENIPVIYHDDEFSPEFDLPGESQAAQPAPRWQPRSSLNNGLSDEELQAILSVDS